MLREDYGLTDVKLTRLHGFFDQNYKVVTPDKILFLKIYCNEKTSEVVFQIDLMKKYRAAKLPVAKIIPTTNGKDYTAVQANRAIVQEFLPGEPFRLARKTSSLYKNLGATLGKMHKLTASETFAGKNWKKYVWDLHQFNGVAVDYQKVKKQLTPELTQFIESVFKEWKSRKASLAKMREGIIHGDYHGSNVLVLGQRCAAVTDFGDANRSWFAADVAIALAHLCFYDNEMKPAAAMKAFLSGYEKYFLLTKVEKSNLELLMRMRAVTVIVEVVLYKPGTKQSTYKDLFESQIRLMQYFG